jgi:hypothetical protein
MAREKLIDLVMLRRIELTDEQRARIGAEPSLEQLRKWFELAADAKTARDVFGGLY